MDCKNVVTSSKAKRECCSFLRPPIPPLATAWYFGCVKFHTSARERTLICICMCRRRRMWHNYNWIIITLKRLNGRNGKCVINFHFVSHIRTYVYNTNYIFVFSLPIKIKSVSAKSKSNWGTHHTSNFLNFPSLTLAR
jgi:hypothetical protein